MHSRSDNEEDNKGKCLADKIEIEKRQKEEKISCLNDESNQDMRLSQYTGNLVNGVDVKMWSLKAGNVPI